MRNYRHSAGVLCAVLFFFLGHCHAEICNLPDEESVLQPGHEYTYHFKSEAFGDAVGTTDDRGKIALDCDVLITHSAQCLYNLQFQNCHLTAAGGSPGSEDPWIDRQHLSELSRYPVSFSLLKGEISDVYTHQDDPLHFVNIKRGVLSAFVFKYSYTSTQTHEIHRDIHGSCPLTATPVHDEGRVKTSKDMLYCAYPSRPDWQFSPWSLFWNMSFIQYVINSTTDCDYKIDQEEKRIENVLCKERHAIMLESSHSTQVAVQTNIYYTITFVKSSPQETPVVFPELQHKTGISFEYEQTQNQQSSPENFVAVAKKMLSDMVQDSVDEIRLFTIPQFTHLVAWLRSVPAQQNDLLSLVDTVKTCSFLSSGECTSNIKDLAMSYLSDALVQCNTPSCFDAVVLLAKNGDLSTAYMNFVYYTWSNMHVSNPVILKTIKTLCDETDSNLCWTSLGTMIKRSLEKEYHFKQEEIQILKDIANDMNDAIAKICSYNSQKSENYMKLLTYFKAVGNMGKHFASLVPEGSDQLMECLLNYEAPDYVKVSVLEALKNINHCSQHGCTESSQGAYQKVLPILTEKTWPTTVRVAAYELLLPISQGFNFEWPLVIILETDEDLELKTYVAHSLKHILNDPDTNIHRKRFVQSLQILLEEKEISLDKLIYTSGAKSFTSTDKFFSQLNFFPDEMKGFGLKKTFSKIYQLYDSLPRHFHKDLWLKAFSTLFPVYQTGGSAEGLEQIAIVLHNLFQDMNTEVPVSMEKILEILPEVIKEFVQDGSTAHSFNFDDTVVLNIKKLEDIFRDYSPKLKPFFTAYLDLFGSTLAHFSSGDMMKFTSDMQKLASSLHEGITYNATRVIRVIEAYHQVPTMMGLPLNWTTNATLAFSFRTGFNFQLAEEHFGIHSKGFFQPSMALTFLNRMVLDFPTVTQIGVQANSSAYTSTQWKINMDYSKDKKKISIQKPQKSQKLLELFRTNQLIKHDDYIDIPDWDIDRHSSSWCSGDPLSSVLGVELCLEKSYPIVTDRLKPWALMSGSCKWQLLLNPTNENITSYEAHVLALESNKLSLNFDVSGGIDYVFLNMESDETKGEMKMELISTPLTILYRGSTRPEDYVEHVSDINSSTKYRKTIVSREDGIFSLQINSNTFVMRTETIKKEESKTSKIHFTFENLNNSRSLVRQILPPALWEDDHKASLQIELNWKAPNHYENSVTRQTVCFIKVPQSTIELNANGLEMPGRKQMNVNLTKTEVETGKMMGFVNYTYDHWSSHSTDSNLKEISRWNVTIPRRSWAVLWQKERIDGSKFIYGAELKRALMLPKNTPKSDFVGWWSQDLSDDFTLQEQNIKANVELDMRLMSGDELMSRYSTLTEQDVAGLNHRHIKANMALHYPLFADQQSITFDGYVILSKGPTIFRFQKNFDLESSYNNLRLTSHSVYGVNGQDTSLYHTSFFTHLPSQTKAFNTMDYKKLISPEGCKEISWAHDIRSHVFDLTTRATYKCHPDDTNLHTLLLEWTTNSSAWNMLDTKLNQLIDDVNAEYSIESVNISHPLVLINVTADWAGKERNHKKRIVFNCLSKDCPDAELVIKSSKKGDFAANLILLQNKKREILYRRSLSGDEKQLRLKMKYTDNEDNDLEDIEFSGEILDEHMHIWNAKINSNTYSKIKSVFSDAFSTAVGKFEQMAKDSNHPLNKILEPALKVTFYDYWKGMKKQAGEMAADSWSSIRETVRTLRSFYDIPVTVVGNTFSSAIGYSLKMYNAIKDKSVTIWAINYFQIPYYFRKGFNNLNEGIKVLPQMLQTADGNIRFEFTTGRILEWASFKEWPSFSFDRIMPDALFPWIEHEGESPEHSHLSTPGSKMAMIFGPLHVYTFDGHVFDTAEYSSDCLFLLAHDLRKSMFSVVSSQKYIHVLLPEMTLSINDENEVFINGSKTPAHLPLQSHNGKVVVSRGEGIDVWSPSLRLLCRNEDFLCILELNAWHSGGTFGLLGNADGSKHNEFMMPNGKVTSNILEFVQSYEISGKSECQNLKLPSQISSGQEKSYVCIERFEKLCKQPSDVKESFLQMCESDLKEGHGPCYSAAGFAALCHFKTLPSSTQCNAKQQESRNIAHKLEVVLIIQEHSSFMVAEKKKAMHKAIERLLTAIDEKFKSSGYSNIQFSLVGFGGKGVHHLPTVHATERNIWVSLRTFANDMLKTLEFNGNGTVDNLQVLQYALNVLGYDTFDSKIIVMLTAEDKQSKNKVLLSSIQQQLEKNGITLYTISSYPSIERGKKVFGVRADGLMFPLPKKEDARDFLDYPKGDLAKLTSGTRGSIFLSKLMIPHTPASYYSEIAQEMWAKVHKEARRCRECKSVRSQWWFVVNECNIVEC